MTEFVASNGLRVFLDEDGGLVWAGGSQTGEPKQKVTQAFREFFQAERDIQLGRWRSKEHPEYVVYPNPNGTVCVVEESRPGGENERIRRGQWVGESAYYPARQVAREYFAAHPEPKPWHHAVEGEYWALTRHGRTELWETRNVRGQAGKVEFVNPTSFGIFRTDSHITAGRRIWPEVSHD